MAATSLTCSFPVDLSVAKIDFSVHHANGTGKAGKDEHKKGATTFLTYILNRKNTAAVMS